MTTPMFTPESTASMLIVSFTCSNYRCVAGQGQTNTSKQELGLYPARLTSLQKDLHVSGIHYIDQPIWEPFLFSIILSQQ